MQLSWSSPWFWLRLVRAGGTPGTTRAPPARRSRCAWPSPRRTSSPSYEAFAGWFDGQTAVVVSTWDIGDDSRAAEKLTAITELVIRRAPQLLGTFGYTPTPTPTP